MSRGGYHDRVKDGQGAVGEEGEIMRKGRDGSRGGEHAELDRRGRGIVEDRLELVSVGCILLMLLQVAE